MTHFKALIGLNMFCGIGSTRLNQLLRYFGKPENILNAPVNELAQIPGIGLKIAEKISSLKEKDIDEEFDLAEKHKLKIITIGDEDYPDSLKQIPDPPIVLYVKGALKSQDKSGIAIVGSRRASLYGLSCAEKFAYDLSGRGITIVSGLARGIDTLAHQGALKSGGRTIAVIGSGFNYLYPAENKKLAEEISCNGAVISEFPINAKPLAQNFPRRNRLISGLSLGVLVVEAAKNSGALITADCALEQGRDVFALPGKIDSPNSLGTNELIKQGAKLVSSAEDILEEFDIAAAAIPASGPSLSGSESQVYGLISSQPLLMDEIVEKTGIGITEISGLLLKLQMHKLVRQLPGKQFIKVKA
ncbi:MAG: DNA-processing protein DprA [Candidatus Omnitrophica bacterium]|nr:DNA-processing protein DprA [Candidatus Omnitrophota bacterium]